MPLTFLLLSLFSLASDVQGSQALATHDWRPRPSSSILHFPQTLYMVARLLSRRGLLGVREAPGLQRYKKASGRQGSRNETKCRVTRLGSTECTGGKTRPSRPPSLHGRKFHPWAG